LISTTVSWESAFGAGPSKKHGQRQDFPFFAILLEHDTQIRGKRIELFEKQTPLLFINSAL
jgi:hypothetical protein